MLAEEFRQWPTNVGYLTAFTRHSTPYRANAASGLTLDPGFQLPGIDSCKQTTAQVWAFPSPGLVSNERMEIYRRLGFHLFVCRQSAFTSGGRSSR